MCYLYQHLVPFPGGMCVIHKLLHSSLLFYPAAVFGNPSVDAGCVYASAAFAPARHTCQEKTPAGVGDRQRPAGVALRESRTWQSTRLTCCEISATERSAKKHHITNNFEIHCIHNILFFDIVNVFIQNAIVFNQCWSNSHPNALNTVLFNRSYIIIILHYSIQ